MDAPVMQIGGLPKGATSEVAEAIVRVATCSPVPDVAIKALEALSRLGQTEGVTVQGCTISGGPAPTRAAVEVVGSDYRFEGEDY